MKVKSLEREQSKKCFGRKAEFRPDHDLRLGLNFVHVVRRRARFSSTPFTSSPVFIFGALPVIIDGSLGADDP